VPDHLAELGALTLKPEANIIKLPNISASVPQLKEAIAELQAQGYAVPTYPENPQTDAEKDTKARYAKVMGSAVNPVLREGNSDRRAPKAVKDYARAHPHSMGQVVAGFEDLRRHHGQATTSSPTRSPSPCRRHHRPHRVRRRKDGSTKVLKETPLKAGEILDGTKMSKKALVAFYEQQIAKAKADGVLFSLHLKATMMKVSDPILFGHAVRVFFKDLIAKHAATFAELGVDLNNGFGDLVEKLAKLPAARRPRSRPTSGRLRRPAPPWPWSTPTRASPISTCPATSSSTPPCPR
jgi:isocitrate dehydrogenase